MSEDKTPASYKDTTDTAGMLFYDYQFTHEDKDTFAEKVDIRRLELCAAEMVDSWGRIERKGPPTSDLPENVWRYWFHCDSYRDMEIFMHTVERLIPQLAATRDEIFSPAIAQRLKESMASFKAKSSESSH